MDKKRIAIFTTGWCSEILSQFLEGLTDSLRDEHADLFLFLCYPTFTDSLAIRQGQLNIFKLPDLKRFDGAVIFGSGLNFPDELNDLIRRCNEAGLPVIMQGAEDPSVYCVGSDNYVATTDLCEHLTVHHDVKDIIFIAGAESSYDSNLRLQAIKDYLSERGLSYSLKEVYYTNWENAAVTQYIRDYCRQGRTLPGAFICANDGLAMEACVSLSAHGYEVPKDVIVTGFDFIEDSQVFDPSIATVDQRFFAMGYECGKLWTDLVNRVDREKKVIIPCKFIPGDSCGCGEIRNADKLRRRKGRENFSNRAMTNYFNRKLNLIDQTILSGASYQEFRNAVSQMYIDDHDYEGDSFHVLLEPNFGLSIYNSGIKLRTDGYGKLMDVIYSSEDGLLFTEDQLKSRDLIPGYDRSAANHMYVFVPLFENNNAYGYLVFRDCMEKVANHFLQTYQNRMNIVLEKFRHSISLDLLNKRLMDLMRKDSMTNVNNRTAYEDMENRLQSEINMETISEFGIVMFDINNLKVINDTRGHDAGDAYIIRSAKLICDIFKHSPVYRIGGDEFVVVLTGNDFLARAALMDELNRRMEIFEKGGSSSIDYISIASGLSVYEPGIDRTIQDVVKRADNAMYERKKEMKHN